MGTSKRDLESRIEECILDTAETLEGVLEREEDSADSEMLDGVGTLVGADNEGGRLGNGEGDEIIVVGIEGVSLIGVSLSKEDIREALGLKKEV